MEDIEIAELAGKAITSAKIIRTSAQEQEFALEFTDGTSFSFSCMTSIRSETAVYRGGVGEPEVIRKLDLD